MGQSVCSTNSGQFSQAINQLVLDQNQVQITEDLDQAIQSSSRFSFLKTQIIASWNILQQTQKNTLSLHTSFRTPEPTPINFTAQTSQVLKLKDCLNKPDKNHQISENSLSILRQTFAESVKTKKHQDQRQSKVYANLQIDISNFIQIRTQNINDIYQFKQKIGEGTFGNVYQAVEKRSGEIRAIKVLKKSMSNTSKMSLVAELDLLKTLDHPNIIKLYDLFLWGSYYYVVTQYCEGGCLQKYFRKNKGSFNEKIIHGVMSQLSSALNYLSSVNVVHRDLKFQNIVFLNKMLNQNAEFEIRLIDFGTAKKIHKHKKYQSGLVGTIFYIAPQFIKGFYTQKCDVWSAGIIFYRLLFQEFPFKGWSQKQILSQITSKSIQWDKITRPNIASSTLDLLKMMLDKNYLTRASPKTLAQHSWIKNCLSQKANVEMADNVVSTLSYYYRKSNFVSVVESFLSFRKVTQLQRKQLSKIFLEIDHDRSGLIEVQELISFFKQKYPEYNQAKVVQIVQNIDKNNSGKIDFNEFITAMSKKTALFADQALRQAFDYVDVDKTGFITKKEVQALLKMANRKEIQDIFENMDEDGDNQISLEQFKCYMLLV